MIVFHGNNGTNDSQEIDHRSSSDASSVSPIDDDRGPVLITGGAGFIGTNLADRLVKMGHRVIIYDNLSRGGVHENVEWLARQHRGAVDLRVEDVRDARAVDQAVGEASAVFHLAAQVAVTTSVEDPRHDFETNILGTLNVLEAARRLPTPPPLLYTSTNKVYGDLISLNLQLEGERYRPRHFEVRAHGLAEGWLDFHSPYGCSKGAADQYVLDYCRTYGLPATVFRMSCIYGPHQRGTEDQGWVAHFIKAALAGRVIKLYGDGYQVRDVLFVEDLTDAMSRALRDIDQTRGRAFNIGGGPGNAVSLIEMLRLIDKLEGTRVEIEYGPWRPGDQKYYVTDHGRFTRATEWVPKVGVVEGVNHLHQWLQGGAASRNRSVAAGKT